MTTPAVEDYLRALYELQDGSEPVRMGLIAEVLGVQPPSVTGMVNKMVGLGLVTYRPYQGVSLSEAGFDQARHLSKRHRLVSRYLVEKLELEEDRAVSEADLLEHVVSQRLAERLEEALEEQCPAASKTSNQAGSPDNEKNGRMQPVKENGE